MEDNRNDIEKGRDLSGEPEAELSTADLAGASPARPRALNVKPLLSTPQSREAAGGTATSSSDIGRSDPTGAKTARALEQERGPLFSGNEANELRGQWDAVQVGFVDEPRRAVAEADKLVAGTMKRLAEIFSDERSKLEGQWEQGQNVSTEDLRLALRQYRSFFDRLLSV
jgi:hypothetical protein